MELGFKCGMFCETCGDAVALDAYGRFTCFTCGKHVGAVDKSQVEVKLPKGKDIQIPLFKTGWGMPE